MKTKKLSSNEQALLDGIKHKCLRNIAAKVFVIKKKLQFTGWLQYLIPLPILVVLSILIGITLLFHLYLISSVLKIICAVVLIIMIFDIVTSKFKVRFPERTPKGRDCTTHELIVNGRKSCRSFQTRRMIKEDRKYLFSQIELYSQKSVRFEYLNESLTVWPVINASEFIIAIAPKKYDRFSILSIGKNLQSIVLKLTTKGIATCWIGPGAKQESIILALGERFDPETEQIICLTAVGYKSSYTPLFLSVFNKRMRRRLSISELFLSKNLNSEVIEKYSDLFTACQWAPSSFNGQTTRVNLQLKNKKITRADFISTTSSKYYAPIAAGIWMTHWELITQEYSIHGEWKTEENREENYNISWVVK